MTAINLAPSPEALAALAKVSPTSLPRERFAAFALRLRSEIVTWATEHGLHDPDDADDVAWWTCPKGEADQHLLRLLRATGDTETVERLQVLLDAEALALSQRAEAVASGEAFVITPELVAETGRRLRLLGFGSEKRLRPMLARLGNVERDAVDAAMLNLLLVATSQPTPGVLATAFYATECTGDWWAAFQSIAANAERWAPAQSRPRALDERSGAHQPVMLREPDAVLSLNHVARFAWEIGEQVYTYSPGSLLGWRLLTAHPRVEVVTVAEGEQPLDESGLPRAAAWLCNTDGRRIAAAVLTYPHDSIYSIINEEYAA